MYACVICTRCCHNGLLLACGTAAPHVYGLARFRVASRVPAAGVAAAAAGRESAHERLHERDAYCTWPWMQPISLCMRVIALLHGMRQTGAV